MLQTWNVLVYVARFEKEKYYFMLRQPLVEITKKSDLFTRTINP